jgi:hypothetical protein
MAKHIQLVGILNIVYRSISLLGGFLLFVLAAGFWQLFDYLVRIGAIQPHEIPMELVSLVPIVLSFVAFLVTLVSILGIVAGVAVLRRREWGRVLLLVVSFFNLIRIPIGTALGIYSIWVLLNNDTIRAFTPESVSAPAV